jgi:hypothetical protein
VSSVVVIKTQSMPTPVSVMRDCALEIDASDLRQWQQIAQPHPDDQRRFRPPSDRAAPPAPPPPPPDDMPGRPRYDAARPQPGLGPQAAEVILRLGIDFESIPDISAFAEEVRADVANAARLDRSRVSVLNMRAGSTIVELAVEGDNNRSGLSIARSLKQQAADPASPLRAGQHTKRTLDVMIPADILPRASGGGAPAGAAAGRPMQGYIDGQGVFRSRGATSPAPDRTQLQAPIFTTNELALSAGFAPTPQQNAGPRPRQAGRPQRGGGGGGGAQQNYAGYQQLLRPVSPAGVIGGGGGRRSQRAPFAMVQVAVNPQGMHPSILSALKQNVGSPPGPAPVNAGPFGGYYAAFGGGSVGGSVVSYGGSSAGGSVVGGGSVFGGGGSVFGDQYPFRLHSSAGALSEFAQQQRPMWGQMQTVQQFGAGGGGMAPMFRDQVQALAGRGQFQGGQAYAMPSFSGPAFAPISAPMPLQMRAMQPNFRIQQQGMSPPRQPMMMQMQAPAAPLMPFQTQVVPSQPQRMQTVQVQQVPMMQMQPQMVQMQPQMMQMQPQMVQMQPQRMQMQPQMVQMQPQMLQMQPQMQMQMQPQMVQQQPQMIQMMQQQQPAIQGVWGY